MAWAGVVVSLIGVAVSAYSSIQQANAQEEAAKESAKTQKAAAETQKSLSSQQADLTLAQGEQDQADYQTQAERLKEQDTKLLAEQRSSWIANGLNPDVGSPLELYTETSNYADEDYRDLLARGQRAYDTAAANASLIRQGADSSYSTSMSSASATENAGSARYTSTLLSGATSTASGLYNTYNAYDDYTDTQRSYYLGTGGDYGWRQELY